MSSNKLNPFCPQNRISRKLVHSHARGVRIVLATLTVWCASNAISSSLSLCFLPFGHIGLISNTQTDVTRWYHVTFWPRDSNAIFEGKIAQLCALVKSTVFIVGISDFGIVYFKRYIFKLCRKQFRFIGTLKTSLQTKHIQTNLID